MNLTSSELQCIHNKEFLLTKAKALNKLQKVFNSIHQNLIFLKEEIKDPQLKGAFKTPGKISKGENYEQLPYLVLDFPRIFKKDNIFAFRTMFWWGNFYSNTIHLQGNSLNFYKQNFLNQHKTLSKENFYICVNTNPWEYHYNKDNYVLVSDLGEAEYEKIVTSCQFLKLSRKIELSGIENLNAFTYASMKLLIQILNNS